jgi:hypothetical protein
VRTCSAAELDRVGPLCVAVHHQHAETMPQLAPYVSDGETWRVQRALYEELLAKTDTLLLLAFVGKTAVDYGLAHVLPLMRRGSQTRGSRAHESARANPSVGYPITAEAGWAPCSLIDSSSTYTQPA